MNAKKTSDTMRKSDAMNEEFGRKAKALDGGRLSDLAPTMLSLTGMEIPKEMTGRPLITLE